MTQNKSLTEKMSFCLLVYDPAISLLLEKILIDSTYLKILSARHVASMNKISITGYANVLLLQL